MTLFIGCRRDPLVGSSSRTTDVTSRSRTIAAITEAKLPHFPSPKLIVDEPSDHVYNPPWKASATLLMYRGDGLEVPKCWISILAKNGAVF